MEAQSFETLDVWRRSARLCVGIYRTLASYRESAYKDQVSRAALSIPASIAEGHERNSTDEYIRFAKIAKGACGELRTQLRIGIEAGLIDHAAGRRFYNEATELNRMLGGWLARLEERGPLREASVETGSA